MTDYGLKSTADLIAIMDEQRIDGTTSQSVWALVFAGTNNEKIADDVQEIVGTSFDKKDSGYIVDKLTKLIEGYWEGANKVTTE